MLTEQTRNKLATIAENEQKVYDNGVADGKRAGTRINHNGTIKKATVDLWDTIENNPDNAPSLWENVMYKDGDRIIPEVITVTSAFSKDEIGWWNDELYISLVDSNVYTPEQYPQGWAVLKKEE